MEGRCSWQMLALPTTHRAPTHARARRVSRDATTYLLSADPGGSAAYAFCRRVGAGGGNCSARARHSRTLCDGGAITSLFCAAFPTLQEQGL